MSSVERSIWPGGVAAKDHSTGGSNNSLFATTKTGFGPVGWRLPASVAADQVQLSTQLVPL